ncbi:hypothetical protein QTP70_027481 [Hemibagrus guttatus]|uniref:Uncharacterized protein n=1 Tax=Hemibagrus guttatus TaxID=175788 RepID=A0AAE0Q1S4_9TELE|nr:hypothetical protein QTP70_027481 [Hemibagrus guttatus]
MMESLRHHWASRQDTPWTECQPITGHTHTLSFTHAITHYGQFRDANQPKLHVFGLGEETPEARGEHANSTHKWRMRESNPQPWRCEANMLTTKPPYPHILILIF